MRRYRLEVNEDGWVYIFRDHLLIREFKHPDGSDLSWKVECAMDAFYCLLEHDGVIPEVPPV